MRRLRRKVNFVGSRTGERHVRSMLVIPESEPIKLTTKACSVHRYDDLPSTFIFDGQDQPLYHGDAAVFADGAVTRRFDAFAFHPASKRTAVEDTFFVANDVFRRSTCLTDRLAQHGADGAAVGPIGEDPDLHDPP